ncbi:MAG: DUF4832 domain-containing protein [Candidatus Gastranaerophilales bacterium]|nr:DUF4832 domain-containing protein [Candidatus Gastranaerophilales bacterium]
MKPFNNIFGKKWKFQKVGFVESVEELQNPARGWYQIHTFQAEKRFSAKELEWCLSKENTLALVLIDIGAYKDRGLDEECLANMDKILKFFVDWQMDIILRIVYDHEGRAQEREPFYFTQVLDHLAQLGDLLSKYADHIYVFQGMLVGNWGEMHTSRFLATDKLKQLASLLRGYLGEDPFLAVRRPMYWRALHPSVCGNREFSETRVGLFDDAIFGSATHMGTFGTKPEEEMGWDDPWAVEEELAFEEKLCQYVPQGGEAVYEAGAAENRSLQETVERLRKMQVSYLNCIYDERQLNLWKHMTWKGEDAWAGMNGYDYIGRHLGYRFCVRNASVSFLRDSETTCLWEISVENTGFARCYQETEVWLEWTDEQGRNRTEKVDLPLHYILPGEIKKGTCSTAPALGSVYLYAKSKKDDTAIYFANETAGKRGVLIGRLNQ